MYYAFIILSLLLPGALIAQDRAASSLEGMWDRVFETFIEGDGQQDTIHYASGSLQYIFYSDGTFQSIDRSVYKQPSEQKEQAVIKEGEWKAKRKKLLLSNVTGIHNQDGYSQRLRIKRISQDTLVFSPRGWHNIYYTRNTGSKLSPDTLRNSRHRPGIKASSLTGTWQQAGSHQSVYTFYSDRTFQHNFTRPGIGNPQQDSSFVETGKWIISNNYLEFLDTEIIQPWGANTYRPEKLKGVREGKRFFILEADSSDLRVIDRLDNEIRFQRLNGISPGLSVTRLSIISAHDTSEQKNVVVGNTIAVIFPARSDSQQVVLERTLKGTFISANDSSLTMEVNSEKIIKKRSGVLLESSTIKYGELPAVSMKSINYRSISGIDHTVEGNMGAQMISGLMFMASGASMLVIAPLASINYRTWDFNKNRFYKIAGTSLAVFSVSVTVMLFSADRTTHYPVSDQRWRESQWYLKPGQAAVK